MSAFKRMLRNRYDQRRELLELTLRDEHRVASDLYAYRRGHVTASPINPPVKERA